LTTELAAGQQRYKVGRFPVPAQGQPSLRASLRSPILFVSLAAAAISNALFSTTVESVSFVDHSGLGLAILESDSSILANPAFVMPAVRHIMRANKKE
jgi:hypothetical protein